MGETPRLWSGLTITINQTNQSIMKEILRSRRLETVRNIIEDIVMCEKGWGVVKKHKGLRELKICPWMLPPSTATFLFTAICDGCEWRELDLSSNTVHILVRLRNFP